MKINHFNIGTRLGCAFAAIILLMAVMLAAMLWQLDRIADAKDVMAQTGRKSSLAKDWREGISTNIRWRRSALANAWSTRPAPP
ncbi:hypothetical protein [Massilia yuzhufengensis]|uniref:Methyl-accepting chemotaxis protein n=1 Tax=Massilia yuzhufengensis TaxID=1164594 RepID=A0A1I1MQC9_9BURK|nr:hypothetical protein [Massilia yuzhufengensis]SFC87581.1 methyl-accepting chemotaxis protein [Massilia yuzhufengensis]